MDLAAWRQQAERELGRPVERIDYQPVPELRVPALCAQAPASSRGPLRVGPWQVAQTFSGVPEDVQRALAAARDGGLEVARVDVRLFRGANDLAAALGTLDPTRSRVALYGAELGHAAALIALQRSLRRDPAQLQLDLDLDPIGRLARWGALTGALDRHIDASAELMGWAIAHAPKTRVFLADETVWHDAGADDAWSVALCVATALDYLRACERAGLPLQDTYERITLRQAVGGRFLLGVAKLRATRRVVARVAELCQLSGVWAQEATPAWRERTVRAPATNLLRHTAAAFAGVVGGASRIDIPAHQPGPDAARLARNLQLILRDEAHLGAVADPAGGAYALEALTDQLAQRVWACLVELEREGGVRAALDSGLVAARIQATRDREALHVRTRKAPITGVSRFPDPQAPPAVSPLDDELPTAVPGTLAACASFEALLAHALDHEASELSFARVGAGVTRATPLLYRRRAEPFERLQARGDREQGRVWLATLGALAEHGARSSFGRELLAAGGLRAVEQPEARDLPDQLRAFQASGCRAALVSMADARFGTDGVQAVRALTQAGATVWVLGRPGPHEAALRDAGARAFLSIGVDAHAALLDLWEHV